MADDNSGAKPDSFFISSASDDNATWFVSDYYLGRLSTFRGRAEHAQVGAAESGGLYLDDHFTWARGWIIDRLDDQFTVAKELDALHVLPSNVAMSA